MSLSAPERQKMILEWSNTSSPNPINQSNLLKSFLEIRCSFKNNWTPGIVSLKTFKPELYLCVMTLRLK